MVSIKVITTFSVGLLLFELLKFKKLFLNRIVDLTGLVWDFLSFRFSVPQLILKASLIKDFILALGVKFIDLALDFGHEKFLILGDFLLKLNKNSSF